MSAPDFTPSYSPWRHGGWYVTNVHYKGGAIGCVSNNFADHKWRIVCHPAPFEEQPTFETRDAAALAEHDLALDSWGQTEPDINGPSGL